MRTAIAQADGMSISHRALLDDYDVTLFGWLTKKKLSTDKYTQMVAEGRIILLGALRVVEAQDICLGPDIHEGKIGIGAPGSITIEGATDFSTPEASWLFTFDGRKSKFETENDIETAILHRLGVKTVKVLHVPSQSITESKPGENVLASMRTWVYNIAKAIEQKVYYPSVSKSCKMCPYQQVCNPRDASQDSLRRSNDGPTTVHLLGDDE